MNVNAVSCLFRGLYLTNCSCILAKYHWRSCHKYNFCRDKGFVATNKRLL